MHILYFHQYFTTPEGAAGLRSYQMARRLIDRGHTVTMVCGSRCRSSTGITSEPVRGLRIGYVAGIRVIEVCVPYSNYDSIFRRSITFIRLAFKNVLIAMQTDYDLLFATSTPLTAGIPGIAMKMLKPGKKFVFEVRDLWPELPKAMGVIKNPVLLRIMGMLERTTYRLADAIIALSPGIREGVVKYSNPSTPVVMIPNGCDIDLIQQTENSHIDRLDEIIPGVSAAKLRAVFTGAHGQANGLDAILDTAKELKKRERTDIYLVLIGDGKMKPELMRRALQEKLDNVVFAGYIPKTELMKVMRHMHVGLMVLADVPAFYYGTSPNKFFDYISLGLPVINNYPGWLADMVGNYKCGLAVAPKNPKAFADALMQLADEPGIRKKMGNKAEQLAADLFDRRRLSNQFADCLENAMES